MWHIVNVIEAFIIIVIFLHSKGSLRFIIIVVVSAVMHSGSIKSSASQPLSWSQTSKILIFLSQIGVNHETVPGLGSGQLKVLPS